MRRSSLRKSETFRAVRSEFPGFQYGNMKEMCNASFTALEGDKEKERGGPAGKHWMVSFSLSLASRQEEETLQAE